MADGSVNFDTKIDTSGFQKGLKTVEKAYEKTADSVEKDSKKSSEKIEKTSEDTSKSVRSQVAALAAEYKKSGMNSSDAMKKAWTDIKINSKSSSEAVKKHISGVGETSEQIFKDSEDAAKSALDGTEIKSNTTLSGIKNKFGEVKESIGETISSVGDFNDKFDSSMNLSVASVAGLVGAIGGISAAVWSVGTDTEQAMNQVAAATGLTGDALEEIQNVTSAVYQNNFGDSMDDVASAVSTVYQQTELTGEALQTATENAFSMRDVFGYDVQESVRTAKALMDNFGISAEDAYNLMVQGAQNGLDKNGDMLDTLNEYSVHYAQLGYSAEDFFGSLENGAESGAFSVDKIGDAMKEFGIRVKDTSDSTSGAFEVLSLNAGTMREKFSAGGDAAQEATQQVLDRLFGLDDQVARNQVGVALFGTMWEDLGGDAVAALMDTSTEISATKDAMGQLNDVKYDSVAERLKALKRTAETEILQPFAEKLMPKLEDGIEWVADNLDEIVDAAKPVGTAIAAAFAVKKVTDFGTAAVKTVKGLKSAFALLNASNPLGWITIAVGAIAAVGTAVYNSEKKALEERQKLTKQTESLIEAQDRVSEQAEEIQESCDELSQSWEDNTDSVEDEFQYYEALYGELQSIVDANGKIKEGYEDRAEVIAGALSEALGIEIGIVDGQIQKYDELKEKIEEVMRTKQVNALLEANEDNYVQSKAAIGDASIAYADMVNERRTLALKVEDTDEMLSDIEAFYDAYGKATSEGTESAANELERAWDTLVRNYGNELDIKGLDSYTGSNKIWGTYENLKYNSEQQHEKLEEMDEDIKESYESMRDLSITIENYENLMTASVSENAEEIDKCTTAMLEHYETAETGTAQSLKAQRDTAYSEWQNIKRAYETGSEGITEAMVTSAHDAYVTADKLYNECEDRIRASGYNSAYGYMEQFSVSVTENGYLIQDALTGISNILSEQAYELYKWGMDNGYQYTAGLAAGLNDPGNVLATEEASKALMREADRAAKKEADINSPSGVAEYNGEMYDEGLAQGIRERSNVAVISAEQMAQDTLRATQLAVSPWNSIVNPVVTNYGAAGAASSDGGAQAAGNWVFPVYLSPNTHVLDTIIISAKDRANAVSGGMTY